MFAEYDSGHGIYQITLERPFTGSILQIEFVCNSPQEAMQWASTKYSGWKVLQVIS